MNEKELEQVAVREIEEAIADVPPEPRVVHCEAEVEWYPDMARSVSEHWLHVLARGADIVVFFDENGKEIGWRDDGRKGTELPEWIDREYFRSLVVQELELPPETWLGRLRPRVLPPVGWTHEGVFFLSAAPAPDEVLRVWVDPAHKHVIQCLFGPVAGGTQGGGS